MDSEQVKIEPKATEIVNNAKLERRKICAVGTTVMRTIESAVNSDDTLTILRAGLINIFSRLMILE